MSPPELIDSYFYLLQPGLNFQWAVCASDCRATTERADDLCSEQSPDTDDATPTIFSAEGTERSAQRDGGTPPQGHKTDVLVM